MAISVAIGRTPVSGGGIWRGEFSELEQPTVGGGLGVSHSKTGDVLDVTPIEALGLGVDWKLVVSDGLRAADFGVGLEDPVEAEIGRVTPLEVVGMDLRNGLEGARALMLRCSGWLDGPLLGTNALEWVEVTPAVLGLGGAGIGDRLHELCGVLAAGVSAVHAGLRYGAIEPGVA